MDATLPTMGEKREQLKGLLIALAATGLFGCGHPTVNSTSSEECLSRARSDSFLVKWKTQVPPEYAAYKLHPQSLTTNFTGTTKSDVEMRILKNHASEFEIAEHDFTLTIEEPQSASTLSATNGQAPPPVWAPQDLQVQDAWNLLGKKGDNIIVAVVDSGIDYNHPLLSSQLWTNPKEIPVNGIDDDANGFVDDYIGWDFTAGQPSPYDGASHGTHVSGIIAGLPQAATGFTGVAPNAKLMPLKFMDNKGKGSAAGAIKAIDYAVAHGARVINASWGGGACSDVLKQDIEDAISSGTVFVAAAGNNGTDLLRAPEWPALYQLPGKITVASYNISQYLSTFSNYGTLVDLAAPGEAILSTVPPTNGIEGMMAGMSGTSMATPFVSGVAALLLSARPDAEPSSIVDAINNSAILGHYGVRTGGKLNALSAANYLLTH